jgi:hypothetical protein
MHPGAKFIAAERGAFEPVEAEAEVIQHVSVASTLASRLTDVELMMLYEFRRSLPEMVQ